MACQIADLSDPFHLPLSKEAFQQYQQLVQIISGLQLHDCSDQWLYICGSPVFSSKKAYSHLIGSSQVHPVFRWLWKSCCQNKKKGFLLAYLLLNDRLSTREILMRKNMILDDYNCVLCQTSTEESVLHLFLASPFAMSC